MSVAFALMSMTCAAGNDLVFKGRMRAEASPWRHLALVAAVWTAAFAIPAFAGAPWAVAAVVWGLISGALGIAANLLLLEAMRTAEVGACATIYRLNLVPATLLAVIVLGEQLTAGRALAVSAAIGAVALIGRGVGTIGRAGLMLAVAACLLRAGMALGFKHGLAAGAGPMQLLFMNGVAWLAGAIAWGAFARAEARTWRRSDLAWGLASGLLVTGNVLFLTLALAAAPLTQVLPITQLSFILTMLAGCALFGERVTASKLAATLLACGCVLLLAYA
ncbi:MAG TPA: EamA family transporter [Planctomycetota bacterium]|nr:EamA family transporter [Planctomycetota bacterium]